MKDINSIKKEELPNALTRGLYQFIHYIALERGLSENTKISYEHDLLRFAEYLQSQNVSKFSIAEQKHISSFLQILND